MRIIIRCNHKTEADPNLECSSYENQISFDSPEETFGGMLNFLVQEGWRHEGGPEQSDMKFYCPKHAESYAPPRKYVEKLDTESAAKLEKVRVMSFKVTPDWVYCKLCGAGWIPENAHPLGTPGFTVECPLGGMRA